MQKTFLHGKSANWQKSSFIDTNDHRKPSSVKIRRNYKYCINEGWIRRIGRKPTTYPRNKILVALQKEAKSHICPKAIVVLAEEHGFSLLSKITPVRYAGAALHGTIGEYRDDELAIWGWLIT